MFFLTVRLPCCLSVSVCAFLLFAFGLTGPWRARVCPADGLETFEALPGGVQFCQAASCVCKACAGGWSCPKRCPLGKTPFAQESEASVVTAQCSCHGELHLELGLLLKSQCGLLVLSCSLLTLLGCCFRAFFCRVLVNKYIRLTEKLCLYFCKQSTGSRLFFKCQVS